MLVCNVSLARRRVAVTADIAEAATATDASHHGNIVFATLVDDPASVRETVDAYVGQLMAEAAHATVILDAGLSYAAAIVEAATARDVSSTTGPSTLSVAVVEAATATDLLDAVKIAGIIFQGALALDGPILPAASQSTIYIEG